MKKVSLSLDVFANQGVELTDKMLEELQAQLRRSALQFVFKAADEALKPHGLDHTAIGVDGTCKVAYDI